MLYTAACVERNLWADAADVNFCFGPVIASSAHDVFAFHAEIAERGTIGRQVRHDRSRYEALRLEQLPHQFQCGFLVASGLDQEIQNLALRRRSNSLTSHA